MCVTDSLREDSDDDNDTIRPSADQPRQRSRAAVFSPPYHSRPTDSGSGILHFSPSKAGRDITPATLDFASNEQSAFRVNLPSFSGISR